MRRLALVAPLVGLVAWSVPGQDSTSVHLVDQQPIHISKIGPDDFLVDFGQVAFGDLSLRTAGERFRYGSALTLRFGEALANGRVDTHPPGSVRFAQVTVTPRPNATMIVAPPPDTRNTTPPAVLTPAAWGVLLPFRWVEVQGWPTELHADQVHRRAAFDNTWSDDAATFHSSDPVLDQIWKLCHYSIKATTFAGVFVDGDRERRAYEADAYIDQLGYYAGDAKGTMPRATFDRLMQYPTWPSEWTPQMVFMAYADWMQTGDLHWLRTHYEGLKTKLLNGRVGPDGLVTSSAEQIRHGDIVDWPPHERDGYVFTGENTVVNAFRLCALDKMIALAEALDEKADAAAFRRQEATGRESFQQVFYNPALGLYRDGIGTDHASLHANLFPLAFGLVPASERPHIAQWLASRGMAGSVYAAQYLLQALFENDEDTAALHLITAPGDRSWKHMVDSGATITWEAWDQKYKPNQDWNHAWGAAPANLLPRFVLGAEALTPGWAAARIKPHPGDLSSAEGKIPTPRGELFIRWKRADTFRLSVVLPTGMQAEIALPALDHSAEVRIAGRPVPAHRAGQYWVLNKPVAGSVDVEER